MSKSTAPTGDARPFFITDHYHRRHRIERAARRSEGPAGRPDYFSQTPDRIGSSWVVERLNAGRSLGLWKWVSRDMWLVVDECDSEGVALNDAQFADLKARALTTTTTPPSSPPSNRTRRQLPAGLAPTEQAVWRIIEGQNPGEGVSAKSIIARLKSQGICLAESSLRRHVLR